MATFFDADLWEQVRHLQLRPALKCSPNMFSDYFFCSHSKQTNKYIYIQNVTEDVRASGTQTCWAAEES